MKSAYQCNAMTASLTAKSSLSFFHYDIPSMSDFWQAHFSNVCHLLLNKLTDLVNDLLSCEEQVESELHSLRVSALEEPSLLDMKITFCMNLPADITVCQDP